MWLTADPAKLGDGKTIFAFDGLTLHHQPPWPLSEIVSILSGGRRVCATVVGKVALRSPTYYILSSQVTQQSVSQYNRVIVLLLQCRRAKAALNATSNLTHKARKLSKVGHAFFMIKAELQHFADAFNQ